MRPKVKAFANDCERTRARKNPRGNGCRTRAGRSKLACVAPVHYIAPRSVASAQPFSKAMRFMHAIDVRDRTIHSVARCDVPRRRDLEKRGNGVVQCNQSFGLAVHCKRARRGLQGGTLAEVLVETYAQWLRKVVSHWVARSLRTLNDARNWPSFLKTAA